MQSSRLISLAVGVSLLFGSGVCSAQTLRAKKTRIDSPPTRRSVQSARKNLKSRKEIRLAKSQAVPRSKTRASRGNKSSMAYLNPIKTNAIAATNDECTSAAVIPAGSATGLSQTFDVSNASNSASDPAVSCLETDPENEDLELFTNRSVWYTYTPTRAGAYSISTCADAPTESTVVDTVMSIYTSSGGCGGTFTQIPTSVANNTNGCDDNGCLNDFDSFFQSVIQTNLQAGVTYYIVVRQVDFTQTPSELADGQKDLQLRVSRVTGRRPNPGEVLISEFRLSAKGNDRDEFIELYNNTGDFLDISTDEDNIDTSTGAYKVLAYDPSFNRTGRFPEDGLYEVFISPGVVLPPRGYYLITNNADFNPDDNVASDSYSLASYARGDNRITSFAGDLFIDRQGIAYVKEVFNSSGGSTITKIDSVGFVEDPNQPTNPPAPFNFVEGTGVPRYTGTANSEISFLRKFVGGTPGDTNNNANDFILVSTTNETVGGLASILGSPGPQNQLSARIRTPAPTVIINRFDNVASATAEPNLVRARTDDEKPLAGSIGSIKLRRNFTNSTGSPVTQLRVRIYDLTTLGSSSTGADARLVDGVSATVTRTGSQTALPVTGLTLDAPPASATFGGGINSTARVATITLAAPLAATAPNNSVNVEIRFSVQIGGIIRYLIAVEAAN